MIRLAVINISGHKSALLVGQELGVSSNICHDSRSSACAVPSVDWREGVVGRMSPGVASVVVCLCPGLLVENDVLSLRIGESQGAVMSRRDLAYISLE